jgi:hypothetical protein
VVHTVRACGPHGKSLRSMSCITQGGSHPPHSPAPSVVHTAYGLFVFPVCRLFSQLSTGVAIIYRIRNQEIGIPCLERLVSVSGSELQRTCVQVAGGIETDAFYTQFQTRSRCTNLAVGLSALSISVVIEFKICYIPASAYLNYISGTQFAPKRCQLRH